MFPHWKPVYKAGLMRVILCKNKQVLGTLIGIKTSKSPASLMRGIFLVRRFPLISNMFKIDSIRIIPMPIIFLTCGNDHRFYSFCI